MPDHDAFFLNAAELVQLTGRKNRRLQIEQLRRMHIPFHVNALGAPVVVRGSLLAGSHSKPKAQERWEPGLN